MKRCTLLTLLLIILSTKLFAQSDEEAVKAVVNTLFKGMRTRDSTIAGTTFTDACIMQTIVNKNGENTVRTEKVDDFLKFIGSPHKEKFDERIVFTKILIDGPLAVVWTDYKFYIGDKFSRCGVNSFQLVKGNKGWQIVYLIDTRRKENCSVLVK